MQGEGARRPLRLAGATGGLNPDGRVRRSPLRPPGRASPTSGELREPSSPGAARSGTRPLVALHVRAEDGALHEGDSGGVVVERGDPPARGTPLLRALLPGRGRSDRRWGAGASAGERTPALTRLPHEDDEEQRPAWGPPLATGRGRPRRVLDHEAPSCREAPGPAGQCHDRFALSAGECLRRTLEARRPSEERTNLAMSLLGNASRMPATAPRGPPSAASCHLPWREVVPAAAIVTLPPAIGEAAPVTSRHAGAPGLNVGKILQATTALPGTEIQDAAIAPLSEGRRAPPAGGRSAARHGPRPGSTTFERASLASPVLVDWRTAASAADDSFSRQ